MPISLHHVAVAQGAEESGFDVLVEDRAGVLDGAPNERSVHLPDAVWNNLLYIMFDGVVHDALPAFCFADLGTKDA